MRVYYFTEARWGIDDIEKRRLKICRFSNMNDPFELFAGEMGNKVQRRQMKEWAEKIDCQYGVLCFSEDWHDPLMWSHYGDRHHGICMGFDVDNQILSEINYSPKRLSMSLVNGRMSQRTREIENLLLKTKFARWRYEREWRVLVCLSEAVYDEKYYYKQFDQQLKLVQVIAGSRYAENGEGEARINQALEKLAPSVEVINSRLAFNTFRVVRNRKGFRH